MMVERNPQVDFNNNTLPDSKTISVPIMSMCVSYQFSDMFLLVLGVAYADASYKVEGLSWTDHKPLGKAKVVYGDKAGGFAVSGVFAAVDAGNGLDLIAGGGLYFRGLFVELAYVRWEGRGGWCIAPGCSLHLGGK